MKKDSHVKKDVAVNDTAPNDTKPVKEEFPTATESTSEEGTTETELKEDMAPVVNQRLLLTGGVVAVLFVGAVAALTSFSGDGTPANVNESLTQEEAQQEVEELLERVGRHIVLPEDETPLIATVINAETLIAEQPFYTGVQDGDRLIVYNDSLKAIIYSPDRDIIVNVGPVQFAPPVDGETPTGTEIQQ